MSLNKELSKHLKNVAEAIDTTSDYLTRNSLISNFCQNNMLHGAAEIHKSGVQKLSPMTISLLDGKKKNSQGMIPYFEELGNFTATFELSLKFEETQETLQITELLFDIHLEAGGIINDCNDWVKTQSAWHWDIHDGNIDSDKTVHPLFHLQFGGNKVANSYKELGIGNLLHLDTPRIATPPIDIVLGLNFFLSNFLHKEYYQKLKSQPGYINAVKYSQGLFWKPYYKRIANFWSNDSTEDAISLIPQLVK